MSSRQLDDEKIFHFARRIQDVELQAEYLDQICVDDQHLRKRVEDLLKLHEQEQSDVAPTEAAAPITESAGQQIGRYKLREQIGEGGWGLCLLLSRKSRSNGR